MGIKYRRLQCTKTVKLTLLDVLRNFMYGLIGQTIKEETMECGLQSTSNILVAWQYLQKVIHHLLQVDLKRRNEQFYLNKKERSI